MAKEVASSETEFYEKLKGGKRILDTNTRYWLIGLSVGLLFMVLGIVDWLADYQFVSTQTTGEQTVVNEYTYQNGQVETNTHFPIFNLVNIKRANGGFLPDFVTLTVHDWIIMGLIIMIGIPAILVYQREGRRLAQIDQNLPFLLREIADSQRIGMQLPRAIAEAAKRNYGPLTPELKKLAAKVSWGIPFREAMLAFRDAVATPLAKQATILILEAERSGGELEKIFDSAKDYVEELLAIKQEREASIRPYIYIVFISYVIFAVVIYVLFTTFFAPFGVQEITTASQQEVIPIPLNTFKVVFLYLLISQGFFSGLVAGKMGHGSVKLGFTYSTVMMTLGLIVHKFLILPAVDRVASQS